MADAPAAKVLSDYSAPAHINGVAGLPIQAPPVAPQGLNGHAARSSGTGSAPPLPADGAQTTVLSSIIGLSGGVRPSVHSATSAYARGLLTAGSTGSSGSAASSRPLQLSPHTATLRAPLSALIRPVGGPTREASPPQQQQQQQQAQLSAQSMGLSQDSLTAEGAGAGSSLGSSPAGLFRASGPDSSMSSVGSTGGGGGGGGGAAGGAAWVRPAPWTPPVGAGLGSSGRAAPQRGWVVATSSLAALQMDVRELRAHQQLTFAFLSERVRELQLQSSQLQRKLREYEDDNGEWSIRYSRRLVLLSNVMLGAYSFGLHFVRCLRTRAESSAPWLGTVLLGGGGAAGGGGGAGGGGVGAGGGGKGAMPISRVLLLSLIAGAQWSLPFFISAGIHIRGTTATRRNLSFLLSTITSAYSAFSSPDNPRAANYFNVFLNLLYVVARYYYLHGLLVFPGMAVL